MRVVTNQETTKGYYRLFQQVSKIMKEKTGKPMQFHHIDGEGLKGITVDMDTKQASGMLII
jgi:hypothetical protein